MENMILQANIKRVLTREIKKLHEIDLELGDLDYQSPGTRKARFELVRVIQLLQIVKENCAVPVASPAKLIKEK